MCLGKIPACCIPECGFCSDADPMVVEKIYTSLLCENAINRFQEISRDNLGNVHFSFYQLNDKGKMIKRHYVMHVWEYLSDER